jgi:hypothetical protein
MSNRDQDIKLFGARLLPDYSYIDEDNIITWYNSRGQYHRVDGPAVIYPDGRSSWFYHGNPCSFNEYCVKSNITDEEKMLLRLQYG